VYSELYALQNTLREHVHAFAVDIGPRTLFNLSSLARAANYIRSVLECAGLSVSEQNYEYYGQQVTNVLATIPSTVGASAYYVVGAHYDTVPETPGALRLSQEVYFAPSIAAAGIAAHEAGHALQDAVDYFPMEARTYIVPMVQLATQTAPWVFIAGALLQLPTLAWIGVILFGSSTLFALITLPVEFDASTRAKQLLISQHIIQGDEQIAGVQKVLGAAAWTYVAAAVSAIGSWLFYIFVLLSPARPSAYRN
jgi:uncharacterized protein